MVRTPKCDLPAPVGESRRRRLQLLLRHHHAGHQAAILVRCGPHRVRDIRKRAICDEPRRGVNSRTFGRIGRRRVLFLSHASSGDERRPSGCSIASSTLTKLHNPTRQRMGSPAASSSSSAASAPVAYSSAAPVSRKRAGCARANDSAISRSVREPSARESSSCSSS